VHFEFGSFKDLGGLDDTGAKISFTTAFDTMPIFFSNALSGGPRDDSIAEVMATGISMAGVNNIYLKEPSCNIGGVANKLNVDWAAMPMLTIPGALYTGTFVAAETEKEYTVYYTHDTAGNTMPALVNPVISLNIRYDTDSGVDCFFKVVRQVNINSDSFTFKVQRDEAFGIGNSRTVEHMPTIVQYVVMENTETGGGNGPQRVPGFGTIRAFTRNSAQGDQIRKTVHTDFDATQSYIFASLGIAGHNPAIVRVEAREVSKFSYYVDEDNCDYFHVNTQGTTDEEKQAKSDRWHLQERVDFFVLTPEMASGSTVTAPDAMNSCVGKGTAPPTRIPTSFPTTRYPTKSPTTSYPTSYPTGYPTGYPTWLTGYPTVYPTGYPTPYPTVYPTGYPTMQTGYPTVYPTGYPTMYPTPTPPPTTQKPTPVPTPHPTYTPPPTREPTFPTPPPTKQPTPPPTYPSGVTIDPMTGESMANRIDPVTGYIDYVEGVHY
jgi:hypothetical protein